MILKTDGESYRNTNLNKDMVAFVHIVISPTNWPIAKRRPNSKPDKEMLCLTSPDTYNYI